MINIESTVIGYLNTALPSVPTYGEVPDSPDNRGEFFVVDKTASETENGLCTAVIAISSYADTKASASALNLELIETMDGITDLVSIADCHLRDDYNFTNVAKKQHRYQAEFEITHY